MCKTQTVTITKVYYVLIVSEVSSSLAKYCSQVVSRSMVFLYDFHSCLVYCISKILYTKTCSNFQHLCKCTSSWHVQTIFSVFQSHDTFFLWSLSFHQLDNSNPLIIFSVFPSGSWSSAASSLFVNNYHPVENSRCFTSLIISWSHFSSHYYIILS